MRELMDLTGRYWDWRVERWDSSTFRLIADNDLTYHHNVEASFTDVAWAATAGLSFATTGELTRRALGAADPCVRSGLFSRWCRWFALLQ